MANNRQVAHVFAQGNNESKKGSNFYTENNKLYSYATCIGFIEKGVTFLSSNSMSPSTSKHLSYARQAVNGAVFYSPAFRYGRYNTPSVKECIEAAKVDLQAEFEALGKATTRLPSLVVKFDYNREVIVKISKLFKLATGKLPITSKELRQKAADTAVKIELREKAKEAQRQANREQKMLIDKADFDAWLTTGKGECPTSYRYGNDYITLDGETVKTSQGAEAPLDHVKKALAFYFSRKTESGFNPYQTNGHIIHLGHFTLDSIDEQGTVKAGCHTFTSEEVGRFATQWGLN